MRRSPARRAGAVAAAALALLAAAAWRQAPEPAAAVVAVAVTVDDMDRSLSFYTGVLPFRTVSDVVTSDGALATLTGVGGRRRVVTLALGAETLELVDYLAPGGQPLPADSRSNDRWFQHVAIIVSDMDQAFARLERAGVERVSPAPQRLPDWNPNAGGIRAFYFHDPDRHALEILSFPPGKGLDRWQRRDALFLGIDHTAIVVGDTARSLAFYRDGIGLRVAGTSDNHGVEQARLNAVPGAHLRITALRGAEGPGVEFLEYLAPRNGRPAPAGARADDLSHWETGIRVPGLASLIARVRAAGLLLQPPRLARIGATPATLLKDPDGHAVRLLEKTS